MANGAIRSRVLSARALLGLTVLCLLVLLGVGAVASLETLRKVRNDSALIRDRYLAQNRLLDELRSLLYLSGTTARDFLFDPDTDKAAVHQRDLDDVRRKTEQTIEACRAVTGASEQGSFSELESQLREYWNALQPILTWGPEQRRREGYRVFTSELFPRRNRLLAVAGEINDLNERQLAAGIQQGNELSELLEQRLRAGLAVALTLGVILAALSLHRMIRLERQAAERYEEVVRTRSELQNLSNRLVTAQEEERRNFARELHDEIGQSLSAILVGLTNLAQALPAEARTRLEEHLSGLRSLAEASVGAVRDMTLLLRPPMLDDLGLVAALEWQGRETARRADLLVKVEADEAADQLPESHRTCIYRVVQEALNNCAQHALASKASVTVTMVDSAVQVTIQDNGRGFLPHRQKGLGLLGIQERVAALGGNFALESQPGEGSIMKIRLPVSPQQRGST